MYFRNDNSNLLGKIRLFHAAAGAKAVDIYINGSPLAINVDFGEITPYKDISPGKYKIEIFKAGTSTNSLLSDTIEIIPNEILTLSIILLESSLSLFSLKDNPPRNINHLTFLRFINFSPNSPLLSLSLPNGDTLFNGVEYIETTGFYPLTPALYNFVLSATSDSSFRKFINNINLEANSSHTIFIIGLVNDTPRLGFLITDDKTF